MRDFDYAGRRDARRRHVRGRAIAVAADRDHAIADRKRERRMHEEALARAYGLREWNRAGDRR